METGRIEYYGKDFLEFSGFNLRPPTDEEVKQVEEFEADDFVTTTMQLEGVDPAERVDRLIQYHKEHVGVVKAHSIVLDMGHLNMRILYRFLVSIDTTSQSGKHYVDAMYVRFHFDCAGKMTYVSDDEQTLFDINP